MGKITINQDALKERREWKRHTVNAGSNIFRFLPPFGDPEVHNGYPYRKWSYVWLADPATGKRKPFASPFSSGGDKCPVKEYADALAKKVEGIIANMTAEGATEDQVKARLEKVRGVQWKLRLTHGYLYNACDKAGEVGLLELKSTAHKAVCTKMQEYIRDYAQDPTSLNSYDDDSGVWFDVKRDGKGKDTKYSADFNQSMEKDDSKRIIKIDDRSPLPENISTNYEDIGYDLNTIYTAKTYDELKAILVANVVALATDDEDPIPDLLISGFDKYDGPAVAVEKPTETVDETPALSTAKTQGKKPVALKLDAEETATEEKSAGVEVSSSELDNDVFAMADDILKD